MKRIRGSQLHENRRHDHVRAASQADTRPLKFNFEVPEVGK